ncbi:MAG: peptidylprolyl isomerase [Planctomycetes bacterium]|nr:peptidylprolyl isomerase [Planctomycetota bacterium]
MPIHLTCWLLVACLVPAGPLAPQGQPGGPGGGGGAQPAAQGRTSDPEALAQGEAARAQETSLSFAELNEVLISRRAGGAKGREILKHLLDTKLLGRLAEESRLVISPAQLDLRTKELEKSIVAEGAAASLAEYLAQSGVAPDVFREHLRLAMIQEILARRALGTPEGEEVNAEKQEMWLSQVLESRGAQMPPPPWADGVAARCGDLEVRVSDYLEYMRLLLPADDVREDCFQLLLQKRVRARMPDLAPEALAKAVEAELARRRKEHELDPRYRGLSYEQVMGAQGLQAPYLKQDPAVVIAALATLWVDRTQGPEGLRATYAKEREHFDGRYGEAVDTRMIFLRAAELPNQLIPRDFAAAERELDGLKSGIKTADDFGRLARQRTEENSTREKEGRIGFVTRQDERLPPILCEALFQAKPAADGTALVGPVRVQDGVCLLWAGVRRPAPGWEEMAGHVHRELRKRFLEGVLTKDLVRTYLDRP